MSNLGSSLSSQLFSSIFFLTPFPHFLPLSKIMAGGTADVRKLFIFTTTHNYFGLESEPGDQPLLYNRPEINNFLDDGNQMLLRVQRSDAGISLSNTVWLPAPLRGPPCAFPASAGGTEGPSPAFLARFFSGAQGLKLRRPCAPLYSFQSCIPPGRRRVGRGGWGWGRDPAHTLERNSSVHFCVCVLVCEVLKF